MGRFRYSYSVSCSSAEDISTPQARMSSLGYDAAVRSGVIRAEARGDPTSFLMEVAIQHLRRLESRHEGI